VVRLSNRRDIGNNRSASRSDDLETILRLKRGVRKTVFEKETRCYLARVTNQLKQTSLHENSPRRRMLNALEAVLNELVKLDEGSQSGD
jgi:hypothetical protein